MQAGKDTSQVLLEGHDLFPDLRSSIQPIKCFALMHGQLTVD